MPSDAKWLAGRGCGQCKQTGYKGRLAIQEILLVNEEIRQLISSRAAELVVRNAARRAGMRTIMEDGIAKGAAGLTTLEEIVRVIAKDETPSALEESGPQAEQSVNVARNHKAIVEAQTVSTATEIAPPGIPAPRYRVLVVEDSKTTATVVKYFLEIEGFEVLLAGGGHAGLEIARREKPDVIVTDLNMPDVDGIAVVKALRADAATRGAAILMLTSESSIDTETLALSAGADDYLVKPVEPRRLVARVKVLVARSVGRRPA
jgi:CheY-like chemotaxis protein